MQSICTHQIDQTQEILEIGVSFIEDGCPIEAVGIFKRILKSQPDNGLAHYNAGVAYHALGRLNLAVTHYRRAIHLLPELGQALHNLAQAYADQNEVAQSIAAYQKALSKNPWDHKSAYNLSLLFRRSGDYQYAIDACERAVRAKPDFAEAFSNLGLMYSELARFDEALVCLEQALLINPDLKEACYNKGVLLQKGGEFKRGIDWYRKALSSDPHYAPARWLSMLSLPMLYDSPEQIDHHRRRFKENLDQLISSTPLSTPPEKKFALEGIQTTTNFYLQYQGKCDLAIQRKYGEFVHRVMAANYPQWCRDLHMPPLLPNERIRLGYVSTYMCRHTIGTFLAGWVEHHDPLTFEIHCYHVGHKQDDMTNRFRGFSHRFHHIPSDPVSAAQQIESDRLHLLVYSDIGMEPTTLQLAALRLAPIQCKGWGHPVTTGLPTMDYYLSSDLMEPKDADQYYSERLVRLPNLALRYQPPNPPKQAKTRSQLGLPSEGFIYLTTQSIFKYLPQHDDLFPEIALQVNNACFVFIQNPSASATERFRRRLVAAFKQYGLEADKYCRFSPRLGFDDFLSLNAAADVLLDTLEWSGGKTTLEALSCGLPVVTCPGRFMRGRHAYAMLTRMGLTETIADTNAEYCRIAVRLASGMTKIAERKK